MYGYIYKTTNLINKKVYIGKHERSVWDSRYLGSGKALQSAIRKYGKANFQNEILAWAATPEELDQLEQQWITHYRQLLGKNCYNMAQGGTGGNAFKYKSTEEVADFKARMTAINQARCKSEKFKQAAKQRMIRRMSSPQARQASSERSKRAWQDPDYRAHLTQCRRDYFATHPVDRSYQNIPHRLVLKDLQIDFPSQREMISYIKTKFGVCVGRYMYNNLIESSKQGVGYKPYHKNKLAAIEGLMIFRLNGEGVTTRADECRPVDLEISTESKRTTTLPEVEEIV